MKNPFKTGAEKTYQTVVTKEKLARFDAGLVHPVYSTFALGKDVEWTCRLFVLDMKESGEEGVGVHLAVDHLYPAPIGSKILIKAILEKVKENQIICTFTAHSNGFLIAKGRQIQKIIDKGSFDSLINNIKIL